MTRNVPVITIASACLLSSEHTIRERVLTIHGIESSGDWQEEIARAFAPHFECKTIKYPHYRWVGPLKLLLEPYIFLVLGVICASVLFWVNHSSRTGWLVLAMLFLVAYLASYWRRSCAFNHVLQQVSNYARPDDQSETHLIAHSLGTFLMGLAFRKRPDVHFGRVVFVGCVLPRSFPWHTLKGLSGPEYRFIDVRNEVGQKDIGFGPRGRCRGSSAGWESPVCEDSKAKTILFTRFPVLAFPVHRVHPALPKFTMCYPSI